MGVRSDKDQAPARRRRSGKRRRVEAYAEGVHVVNENFAELVVRDLADEADAEPERRRAGHAIRRRAAADLPRRSHGGIERVGFLGVRAPFGIAFQFRYAYNLIARNGVLFDGVGGTVHDQVDALGPEDVLIAISQDPYSTPTVEAVITAAQRGVTVVALTDSALSPLARNASHFLLFRADSISFFPSMIAPLALVELLVAWLAAKGGRAVLKRLGEVDSRLAAQRAYWNRSPRNAIHRSSP